MSDMNVQQLLAQMRVLEAQAKSQVSAPAEMEALQQSQRTEFSEVLANSINSANETMMASGKMSTEFQKGTSEMSMAELMVNMEKASVSFQAMTQVRNKLLSAYQDIMNMPV